MDNYKKSDKYNYYLKSDSKSISYSDGSDTEDRIYHLLKLVEDKSTLSDELVEKIVDWPTEYHFTWSRHCLLRPLNIKKEHSVLELGCGCGAITRYLGETGAEVDSVEGTHSRARIAGERCIDLDNVRIYVDDLLKFESTKKYDWVLFIGVLEYAPIFSNEKEAVQHYLREAKKYLKPNGRLVIAIENKLGLKYFNGCVEDHVNQPFFGIENRYSEKTPVTFGRKELSRELKTAGFTNIEYYYPFPDYKLPSFVVHESAFKNKNFRVSEVLSGLYSRDYSGSNIRAFDESYVWPELERNDILQEMSNSFLLIASNEKSKDSNILAWYYNTNRLSKYATQTIFQESLDNIKVIKEPFDLVNADIESTYKLNSLEDDYIGFPTLQSKIEESWHKSQDRDTVLSIYKKWLCYVLDKSDIKNKSKLSDIYLPSGFLDLTPFNIKVFQDEYYPFDQEWSAIDKIPFVWVAFRGLHWSLSKISSVTCFNFNTFDVLRSLFESLDIVLEPESLNQAVMLEEDFIKEITGRTVKIDVAINKLPTRYENILQINAIQQDKISLLEEKIHIQTKLNEELKASLDKYMNFAPIRVMRKLKKVIRG